MSKVAIQGTPLGTGTFTIKARQPKPVQPAINAG